jgi:hypothetical protein
VVEPSRCRCGLLVVLHEGHEFDGIDAELHEVGKRDTSYGTVSLTSRERSTG